METDFSAWLVVVPARLGSERLPRKPLQDLGGKPLIVRVAERLAPLAKAGALVVVATDAQEVVEACKAHGVEARMTRADHPSGTDRCFEVALGEPSRSYVLNVQGDEPTVDLQDLDRLCSALAARPECRMATLAYRRRDKAMAKSPNVVKVLRDEQGHATYFSRLALPFERDAPDGLPEEFWHHQGIYAFRKEALAAFCQMPVGAWERAEKLEQLRVVERGWRIYVEEARHPSVGIDTKEDLEAARALFR